MKKYTAPESGLSRTRILSWFPMVMQKSNVVSAEANPDYTHRPEPSEIVEVLKKIG